MPNRQLSKDELEKLAYPLLADVRRKLKEISDGNEELLWALRRKIAKELSYDERGKPMQRVALKKKKRADQGDQCAICGKPLPARGSVLERLEAMGGYTTENTQLLCPECDARVQTERGFA